MTLFPEPHGRIRSSAAARDDGRDCAGARLAEVGRGGAAWRRAVRREECPADLGAAFFCVLEPAVAAWTINSVEDIQ